MARLIRRREVERRTGLSRSTLYLFISKGRFPEPVKLGERAVAWSEQVVDDWIEAKIAGREWSAS